jgi:hypothetical protein
LLQEEVVVGKGLAERLARIRGLMGRMAGLAVVGAVKEQVLQVEPVG